MICSYHPENTRHDEGMHRCPECGAPCIAGMTHPITEHEEPFAPVDVMTFDQSRLR